MDIVDATASPPGPAPITRTASKPADVSRRRRPRWCARGPTRCTTHAGIKPQRATGVAIGTPRGAWAPCDIEPTSSTPSARTLVRGVRGHCTNGQSVGLASGLQGRAREHDGERVAAGATESGLASVQLMLRIAMTQSGVPGAAGAVWERPHRSFRLLRLPCPDSLRGERPRAGRAPDRGRSAPADALQQLSTPTLLHSRLSTPQLCPLMLAKATNRPLGLAARRMAAPAVRTRDGGRLLGATRLTHPALPLAAPRARHAELQNMRAVSSYSPKTGTRGSRRRRDAVLIAQPRPPRAPRAQATSTSSRLSPACSSRS